MLYLATCARITFVFTRSNFMPRLLLALLFGLLPLLQMVSVWPLAGGTESSGMRASLALVLELPSRVSLSPVSTSQRKLTAGTMPTVSERLLHGRALALPAQQFLTDYLLASPKFMLVTLQRLQLEGG